LGRVRNRSDVRHGAIVERGLRLTDRVRDDLQLNFDLVAVGSVRVCLDLLLRTVEPVDELIVSDAFVCTFSERGEERRTVSAVSVPRFLCDAGRVVVAGRFCCWLRMRR
jgi:hypothetical protein